MKTSELHTLKSLLTDGIRIGGEADPVKLACVFIPKIQRAYAQGRSQESDIRKDFLNALFDVLTAEQEQTIELSFLFGSKQIVARRGVEGFELLDGQQRVTTLFLLYWYVAMKEMRSVPEFLSKFTYETRDTSTQFLAHITESDVHIHIGGEKPSVTIKSKKWFADNYYCDPTVCAMLTMLDAIDTIYCERLCAEIFGRLERLKFYVLMLEHFDMNDELYIKMNSRGLALTPFENFKASLVQYMKKRDKNGLYGTDNVADGVIPFWFSLITQLDARWIDIFWKYNPTEEEKEQVCEEIIEIDDREIGTRYFNFINRYLFTKAALVDSLTGTKVNALTAFFYNDAESDKMKTRLYGWENYAHIFWQYEETGRIEDTIFYHLQKVFEVFRDCKDEIDRCVQNDPFDNTSKFGKEPEGFHNQYERVLFAAVTEFIEYIPDGKKFTDSDVQANFKRMLRVMFNIMENTVVGSVEQTVRAVKLCHDLVSLPRATTDNFYKSMATGQLVSKNEQLLEEVMKAKAMFSDTGRDFSEWEDAIIEAEHHPFFKGFIGFFFSEQSMDCAAFRQRYSVVKELFDASGIASAYRAEHILMRALLARRNSRNKIVGLYVTEDAEPSKYLKNGIIRQEETRKLFCNYFESGNGKTIEEYFADEIERAAL